MAENNISSNEVYYQIFVGSFADSSGDGIGDLNGITKNLDYLNDGKQGGLGVGGIWLTPIHLSESFHKYDALDYKKVATQFGNTDDLKELIQQAHKKGIKVILDLVFNCVSDDHPWFLEALCNKDSKYRDYFYFWDKYQSVDGYSLKDTWGDMLVWRDAVDDTGNLFDKYIGIYGKSMPDLNFYNNAVREECKEVASFWLELGVDGFRLDSALHLFSESESPNQEFHQLNIDWWKEFYEHCKSIKPDVYLVGEVWGDNETRSRYMQGLKSDFCFFLGDAISDVVTQKSTAVQFSTIIENEYTGFRKFNGTDYINAPFLSNHDEPRYAGQGYTLEQLKMSASIYLTLEGLPFIYYGEELGIQGPRQDGVLAEINFEWPFGKKDMFVQNRVAFPWNNKYQTNQIYYNDDGNIESLTAQMQDKNSLYNHYKKLIHIRKNLNAFNGGSISILKICSELISYKIKNGNDDLVVIHNVSSESFDCKFDFQYKFAIDINNNIKLLFNQLVTMKGNSSYIFCN